MNLSFRSGLLKRLGPTFYMLLIKSCTKIVLKYQYIDANFAAGFFSEFIWYHCIQIDGE
tara:strand:- start:381 stop:557 length:177 start_codon:yes stop_codon:yes gene_type:complete